jgi:hypothetical protein
MGGLESGRPFREVLTELTFEANEQGLDPFEAYICLREKMEPLGLTAEDYCGSSITSGGHARDISLEMGEVIRRNTDLALNLCDELFSVGQLSPRRTVEAVALGKIAWQQSGYMTFWECLMAGVPARGYGIAAAIDSFRKELEQAIERNEHLDMDVYDSKQSPELRAPHYFEHASVVAQVAQQHNPKPVERLVRLVDADTSLGSQAEKVFARLMRIGTYGIALAKTGVAARTSNLPPTIVRDVNAIVSFGGTVFDETRQEQPILVRQPTE